MLRNIFFILFLLIGLTSSAIDLNFKFYKAEDGLSSNTVHAVIQDSRGYMWFGTEDGLNKFDGYEFTSYKHNPRDINSIKNNYVYTLTEDTNNNIWIGSEGGVCIYNYEKNEFTDFNVATHDSITITERIQDIIIDDDKIWIAASRQGIFLYENEKLVQYKFDNYKEHVAEQTWVVNIYKDLEDTIWVVVNNTNYQVYKYNKKTDTFEPAFPNLPKKELMSLNSHAILEDSYGNLWFGTWNNGLIAVNKKESKIIGKYLNIAGTNKIMHIHSLSEYDKNTILIGSNEGLTSFRISQDGKNNHLNKHILEPQISNRFVYPIYKDKEGGLWIGTFYGGINYASPNRNYISGYNKIKHENSISGNVVSSFCEDYNNNIWIGTEDGGLNKFNPKTKEFSYFKISKKKDGLSFDNIHYLCLENKNLWVGTYAGGINVINLETDEIKHFAHDKNDNSSIDSDNIHPIYYDNENNIWIGTTKGINLYDKKNDNFIRVKNIDDIVTEILRIDDELWVATINKGLFRYNIKDDKWKNYVFEINNKNSIISNDVICLLYDSKNQFWIGTNNGLCRYDFTNDTFIDEKIPFPSNHVCKIFEEDEILWISTLNGLISYNPSTKHYRRFTQSDGLTSNLFSSNSGVKASNGIIYIGTPNGFNSFKPKQMIENKITPKIEVTNFQLFNKNKDLNKFLIKNDDIKTIKLKHNQNSFSFEFTALSYFAPEKNRYKFMLEGFDKDWNNPGIERKATYTNIQPGKYIFKIIASNNDYIWNEEGYKLNIIIIPPIWLTWWAILIYFVTSIATLILMINSYLKKTRKKQEEKIKKLKDEQEKEANESKIEFFTNIAHEIRTPLSLISAPLSEIINSKKQLPDDIADNLKIMDNNSNRLLLLVNQLLDFSKIEKKGIKIKIEKTNIISILKNTAERFKPAFEQNNINFTFSTDSETFETGTDSENLTKVISNLLSNAIKYTTDYIELKLISQSADNKFIIIITDNGPGLPEEEKDEILKPFYQIHEQHKSGTGIGLYFVKSIVDALNGQIHINNNIPSGVSFSTTFPKIKVEGKEIVIDDIIIEKEKITSSKEHTNTNVDKTLLIVEDNKELQSFLANHFTKSFNILTANNGVEGISILEKTEIDIIISDVMMPLMDGNEFVKNVKRNYLWSHIPIIMLTAKTDVNTKIESFDIGADAYIEKPFNLNYLSARLNNLLENRKLLFQKYTQTPHLSIKSIAGNKVEEEFLIKVNEIIEKNIDNSEFKVEDLAIELNISSSGLFAKIRQISGDTPNKLIQTMRLKKAAELIVDGQYRINEICYMVGFSNPSYFSKCFQKQFGKLPKNFSVESDK